MWKILNNKFPDDFVIATNNKMTIKHFVNLVAKELNISIKWKGRGINEKAFDQKGNCIIEINKRYFRPLEVNNLRGNFNKAKKVLKWRPKKNIKTLIKEMIDYELEKYGY